MTAQEVNYPDNVAIVSSEEELLTRRFSNHQNVVALPRTNPEGFCEMAQELREYVRFRFDQTEQIDALRIIDGANEASKRSQPEITWKTFDEFVAEKDLKVVFHDAMRRVQEDRKLFNVPELRIHWSESSVDRGHHPDGAGDLERGRMMACYSEPTTKGWSPSQQYLDEIGRAQLERGQEDNFFEFSVGDLWRHACCYRNGVSDRSAPMPMMHEATIPNSGSPRVLMVDSSRIL